MAKAYTSRRSTAFTPADVRAWARENDRPVGTRGRLHPDLVTEYLASHREVLAAVVATTDVTAPKSLKKTSDKRVAEIAREVALRVR